MMSIKFRKRLCGVYGTDNKPSRYFLPSFESSGILVQQKFKINFQDGGHVRYKPIGKIFTFFVVVVIYKPSQSQFGLSVQEKKFKIDGGYGGRIRFSIERFSIF